MHKTSSTGVSKGVEKYWNFLRGFLKNSDFLRGFLKKKFLRGSKIRNLVNGGVWILNGMAHDLWANINLTDFVIILSLNKNKFDLVYCRLRYFFVVFL